MEITVRINKSIRFLIALTTVLFAGHRPSHAQDDPEVLRAVMIISHASTVDTNASDAVQGYLADLPVDLVVESSSQLTSDLYMLEALALGFAERHGAKVVFAADFAHQNRVLLYVSLPRVGTTMLRSIDCTDESVESRYEAVSMVIRGILQAMVKGGEIGVHEPAPLPEIKQDASTAKVEPDEKETLPPEESNPVPSPPPPPPRPWLGLTTACTLSMLSSEFLAVFGIRTGILGIINEHLRVFAAYRFTLPFKKVSDNLALDVYLHPVELGATLEWQIKDLSIATGGALLLDPVSWRVTPRTGNARERPDTIALRVGVAPHFSFGWLITNAAVFFLSVSCEIYIYQQKFKYDVGEQRTSLIDLWRLNPLLQAGLKFVII
jgi:hypothetical protein